MLAWLLPRTNLQKLLLMSHSRAAVLELEAKLELVPEEVLGFPLSRKIKLVKL